MANSVGGHYSRSMLNKFKCLFCKYVYGITDGHSQSRMQASTVAEGEKERSREKERERECEMESKSEHCVSLGSTLLASRIRHVVQLIF